jgi:hypothetical protein
MRLFEVIRPRAAHSAVIAGTPVPLAAAEQLLCRWVETRLSYLVSRAAPCKATTYNHPIGSKVNSDCPQRTLLRPRVRKMRGFRPNTAIFDMDEKKMKKLMCGKEILLYLTSARPGRDN